jgi:tetratricopeptide (TPR) repeat protein
LGPLLALAVCGALLSGCAEEPPPEFKEALSLYHRNQLGRALPLFEAAADKQKTAEHFAYLAETYRRLDETDKAAAAAEEALELDECNSFAHTVLAAAYNPMYGDWEETDPDLTWRHLMKAVECDSTDGDAWSWIWTQAIRRGDRAMERKALRRMVDTGFLTPPILSFNRWLLRNLPEDALFVTNGDWDTYPSAALQVTEGFRPDVAIVNRSLLNIPWYAEYLKERYSLPLPFSDEELAYLGPRQGAGGRVLLVSDQLLDGWAGMRRDGELVRPITISVTVSRPSLMDDVQERLRYAGSFWLWHPDPVESQIDTALVRLSLTDVDADDFAGPFYSELDRSPVRRTVSNRLVDNLMAAGLRYADALIKAGKTDEALRILAWTDDFQAKTDWDSELSKGIARLKEAAADASRPTNEERKPSDPSGDGNR